MQPSIKDMSITFDLDGTLVDTAPDLVRVLNIIIAQDGLPETSYEHARRIIGHGSMALIKQAYVLANKDISEERALEAQKDFLCLYAEGLSQVSKPYPGVPEVLALLKREGAQLSVCTNKPGYMARPLLEQLNLSQFFDRIIGSADITRIKPAADHIFTAIGHRGIRPTVMIGDGITDVHAARAAKVPVILMSYGYSVRSIHTFGADAVLRNFRELPSALMKVF